MVNKLTNTVKPLDEVDKINEIIDALDDKQDTLVSGSNIKTINNNSILGSGNLALDGLPSQTGNANKFLTTDGTDASWAPVHHDLSIFDIVPKDHILSYEETKGFAQLGSYVYKEAVAGSRYGYPDFYAKVIAEYQDLNNTTETVSGVTITVNANGHKFYDIADKADIDSLFTTRGEAWFYGIDSTNERIFLPRSTRIKFGDSSAVGEYQEAGLPNITGSWTPSIITASSETSASGAFSATHHGLANVAGGGGYQIQDLYFNANSSSSIYGNSTTVEYSSTKLIPYMVVGNVSDWSGMTDVVNQGMTILEQVNQGIQSRILLDGSNAQFPYITETYTNGTSWYRVYSDGWCEQGGVYSNNVVHGGTYNINLLKNYIDTNYSVVCSFKTSANANTSALTVQTCWSSKTTSSFDINYGAQSGASVYLEYTWQAGGYIN